MRSDKILFKPFILKKRTMISDFYRYFSKLNSNNILTHFPALIAAPSIIPYYLYNYINKIVIPPTLNVLNCIHHLFSIPESFTVHTSFPVL